MGLTEFRTIIFFVYRRNFSNFNDILPQNIHYETFIYKFIHSNNTNRLFQRRLQGRSSESDVDATSRCNYKQPGN